MAGPPTTIPLGDLPPELDDPLFRTALGQLEGALERAEVPASVAQVLRFPERALAVAIPVRLDDGSLAVQATASSTRACSARRRAASATTWP